MHTHVIQTTTSKLNEELDAWQVWDEEHTPFFHLAHVGSRDWVIVIHHSEHQHRDGDEPRWNPELRDDEQSTEAPPWFIEVWDALCNTRPINFRGKHIPKWLENFLGSEQAMGTARGQWFQ